MAGEITGLTALASGHATGDLIELVDISDTTMSANGTNKKTTLANLFANVPSTITSAADSYSGVGNGPVLARGANWAIGSVGTAMFLQSTSLVYIGTMAAGTPIILSVSATTPGVAFINTGISQTTTSGLMEVNSGAVGTWRDLKVRKHYVDQTITAGGTTGAQTINKAAGTVNFAAAATSLVVTNNLVTTSSTIFCTIRTNDGTAVIKNVVPAAGSFTITLNAAATAETSVGFLVVN